jgi:hypothetical protein
MAEHAAWRHSAPMARAVGPEGPETLFHSGELCRIRQLLHRLTTTRKNAVQKLVCDLF